MAENTTSESNGARCRGAFIVAGVVACLFVAAAVVYRWDAPISDWMQNFLFTKTTLGRAYKLLGKADVVIILMFFVAWLWGDRLFFWRFLAGSAVSGIAVLLLKITVQRQRPGGSSRFNSFPSGDSQTAFVWAVMLAHQFPAIAAPALLGASAVAIFRVTSGSHYPSDVLFGSALGIAGAYLAIRRVRSVPRLLYRMMRRVRHAWLVPAIAAGYVIIYAIVEDTEVLITAGILMPVAVCSAACGRRRLIARFKGMKGRCQCRMAKAGR